MNLTVSKNKLAEWSFDLEAYDGYQVNVKPVDISKLTVDEQADLIVKKLSEPPKPKRSTEYDIMVMLSKSIAEEIDREILKEFNTKGLSK
jgi:ribosomal protein S3AE